MLSGDPGGPVVVAVGLRGNGQAVDWAAAEAAARGCRLHVVHAERLRWTVDPSGLVPVGDVSSCRLAAEEILRVAVRRARAVAPDVEVSEEAMFGSTVRLVVAQGRRAQLLVVVGGRAGRPARGAFSAAVSRSVARRARCPVVVVRGARTRAVKTWRGRRDEPRRAATMPLGDPTGTDAVRGRGASWE